MYSKDYKTLTPESFSIKKLDLTDSDKNYSSNSIVNINSDFSKNTNNNPYTNYTDITRNKDKKEIENENENENKNFLKFLEKIKYTLDKKEKKFKKFYNKFTIIDLKNENQNQNFSKNIYYIYLNYYKLKHMKNWVYLLKIFLRL